jgi:ABC-type multidrug transport system ATPase subunit
VGIINEGRLLYLGETQSLIAEEKLVRITAEPLEDAFLLLSRDLKLSVDRNGSKSLYVRMQPELIPQVNAYLVTNDINVMELAPQRATLEEVFINLTGQGSEVRGQKAFR